MHLGEEPKPISTGQPQDGFARRRVALHVAQKPGREAVGEAARAREQRRNQQRPIRFPPSSRYARVMHHFCCLLVLLLGAVTAATPQEPPLTLAELAGENLRFRVSWTAIPAAHAQF